MAKQWFLVDWECCVGAGGEGEVFLARSANTWELCAVKVSTSLDRREASRQLEAELEQCSRAAGSGAVGLVAWNLDAKRPFLVFEFAHAGSLADEMREVRNGGEVYHPARALDRIRGVLSSLAAVHARGLVHRDVKPGNLLRFGDALRLADFGAAASDALPTEAFVGTRMYASPEQLRGEPSDERADLYAVGCILHEMLTGSVPRPAESADTGSGKTSPSRTLVRYPNLLVLPELDQLVGSLLDEQPVRRPPTATIALRRVDAVRRAYSSARSIWKTLGLGPSPY